MKGKGIKLPRRRESGAVLTVWMREPPYSNEARGEGSPWWLDIVIS